MLADNKHVVESLGDHLYPLTERLIATDESIRRKVLNSPFIFPSSCVMRVLGALFSEDIPSWGESLVRKSQG